ncbi:MAG: hypothetical protein ABSE49_22370 [Polyangiaceae bacterium]
MSAVGLAGAGAALGCGATPPPAVEAPGVAASAEPPPRRPDAVVVEPPAALPVPASHAPARGVVALREPLAGDALRDAVMQVAEAWQQGSLEALVALLTSDAGAIDGRSRGRGPLVEAWRQRLRSHEYARLSGVELVRPERIERWSWDELGASDAPARPAEMRADEVYVRVPFEVTRLANEKVFDDVMVLLLRLEDGRYKVSAYGEIEGR